MTDSTPEEATPTPGVPERARSARSPRKEPTPPPRVMSIHAHPDDQEFTVGGTLAKWARAGSEIVTVCITSGGAGSNDHTPPDMTREALVPIREDEQRRACRVLGPSDVALDAVFPSAETRLIFPELLDEGLEPHKVRWVYIHGATPSDTFIDIADVLDLKIAALKEHKTQMGPWDPTEMITGWAREQGARRKLKAAETFRLMRFHES